MSTLKVWCLPTDISQKALESLYRQLVKVVESHYDTFGLKRKDLTVLFPPDRMQFGLGEDIVVEFDCPWVTVDNKLDAVRDDLARTVKRRFPEAIVKIYVRPASQYERSVVIPAGRTRKKTRPKK